MDYAPITAVRKATERRAQSEEAWREAIRQAHIQGHSLREIAWSAGVKHTRVLQIVREQ